MSRRLTLHEQLEEVLGSKNVYFQPPPTVRMKYPAIRYTLSTGDTIFADNIPYRFTKCYSVTIITPDPDNDLVDKMAMKFASCKLNRTYTSDNLNHYNFVLYF